MPLQSSALPTQLSKGADEYISIFGSNVPLSNVPMCEIKVRSLPWVKTGSCFRFFLEHFQCLISSRSSCPASYYTMDPFPAGSFQNRTDLCKESFPLQKSGYFAVTLQIIYVYSLHGLQPPPLWLILNLPYLITGYTAQETLIFLTSIDN